MSQDVLSQIIERASTDAEFRAQLEQDPRGTLALYDLTEEERAALTSGDAAALQSLGVDARISKFDSTSQTPFAS